MALRQDPLPPFATDALPAIASVPATIPAAASDARLRHAIGGRA